MGAQNYQEFKNKNYGFMNEAIRKEINQKESLISRDMHEMNRKDKASISPKKSDVYKQATGLDRSYDLKEERNERTNQQQFARG